MNNQSLVRRFFAMVVAAVLAVAFAVAGTAPASAAVKGYLRIVSIADDAEPQAGVDVDDRPFDIVHGRDFNVEVEVRDAPQNPDTPGIDGQLTTVTRATEVVLEEVSGPGVLGPTIRATIERDASSTTISGATYSQYANDVELRVTRGRSGVDLAPSDPVSVDVALTAVSRNVAPNDSVDLTDPNCPVPTSNKPTCGRLLLPKEANGHVVLSVGACENPATCGSLVVTAVGDLGSLYTETPATLIIGCDKVFCGGTGVPKLPVVHTFNNGEAPTIPTEECPAKGVTGSFDICVDYVQSTRNQGDLFTYVLFDHDLRASHP